MNNSKMKYCSSLSLADQSSWIIAAEDDCGIETAYALAKTMQLGADYNNEDRSLILLKNSGAGPKASFFSSAIDSYTREEKNEPIVCQLVPPQNIEILINQLIQLSLIFCSKVETNGGILIHGALAVKDCTGIIMAGPGNIGKSTASLRLPPPWQSLSDDCSLIVKDHKGHYHVHPWPTWSNFITGKNILSWDVQRSASLKAIFLLTQNETDQVEPIGSAQAVCMISETAEQAWWAVTDSLETEKKHTMSLQRFNNICELVRSIPVYLLHISKAGAFWEEIEKVLPGN